MSERWQALLGRRARAYKTVFKGPAGRTVLADLRRFCGATRLSFQPGDPQATALREGRREVWLRIQGYLKLSDDDIYRLSEDMERHD